MGQQANGASEPWKCSLCNAVVFIPTGLDIDGGVCTQEKRGCKGEIERMTEQEARAVRDIIRGRGIREQPWLTLVFATKVT